MASVAVFVFNPVFQAPGLAAWNLNLGDRDNFWGFSARPFQSNSTVELVKVAANTGNGIQFVSTDIVVNVVDQGAGGGLVRLVATRVTP